MSSEVNLAHYFPKKIVQREYEGTEVCKKNPIVTNQKVNHH